MWPCSTSIPTTAFPPLRHLRKVRGSARGKLLQEPPGDRVAGVEVNGGGAQRPLTVFAAQADDLCIENGEYVLKCDYDYANQ